MTCSTTYFERVSTYDVRPNDSCPDDSSLLSDQNTN